MVKIKCRNMIDQEILWNGPETLSVARSVLSDSSLVLEVSEPCLSDIQHKFVGLPYTGGATVLYPQPWSAFILLNWNHSK